MLTVKQLFLADGLEVAEDQIKLVKHVDTSKRSIRQMVAQKHFDCYQEVQSPTVRPFHNCEEAFKTSRRLKRQVLTLDTFSHDAEFPISATSSWSTFDLPCGFISQRFAPWLAVAACPIASRWADHVFESDVDRFNAAASKHFCGAILGSTSSVAKYSR